MSINSTIQRLWTFTLFMDNGQTVELDVRGKSISECREKVKLDPRVKKILKVKKTK